MRARFLKRAIAPEKVAELIISAIRNRKFFIITSFDIKLLFFFKKYCFPIYHLVMLTISRVRDKLFKKTI